MWDHTSSWFPLLQTAVRTFCWSETTGERKMMSHGFLLQPSLMISSKQICISNVCLLFLCFSSPLQEEPSDLREEEPHLRLRHGLHHQRHAHRSQSDAEERHGVAPPTASLHVHGSGWGTAMNFKEGEPSSEIFPRKARRSSAADPKPRSQQEESCSSPFSLTGTLKGWRCVHCRLRFPDAIRRNLFQKSLQELRAEGEVSEPEKEPAGTWNSSLSGPVGGANTSSQARRANQKRRKTSSFCRLCRCVSTSFTFHRV